MVFYSVTNRLQPDFEACAVLARQQPPDIFVLVHYFGQPRPAKDAAAFCRQQGAWLVEDATHVLRPVPGVGEDGDCVLYSPHKHLPIPDGAVLVVRENGPGELSNQPTGLRILREIGNSANVSAGFSNRPAYIWLAKRALQRLGIRRRRKALTFMENAEADLQNFLHPRMSTLAKRILSSIRGCLDEVAHHRERNATEWHNQFSRTRATMPAIDSMQVDSTPYLAGFSFDQEDAKWLFGHLQEYRLPVTTWPDLPSEVLRRPSEHWAAIALRYSHIYFPIHQSLRVGDIQRCGRKLLDATTIHWQLATLSSAQWDSYWRHCSKANLLQSWQYGNAKEEAEGWRAQRFLISDNAGQPVALMQVLTRGLPFIGGIARLNRGPLLITDRLGDVEIPAKMASLRLLLSEARRQHWWLLQAAPELPPNDEAANSLRALGFKRVVGCACWGSALLNLTVDEQPMRMSLDGKWRNCLRKGEKLGVTVTKHEFTGVEYDLFMKSYSELQDSKGFAGIPNSLVRSLGRQEGLLWEYSLFVARATGEGERLGVLVTIRHGDTATYMIGSVNDEGRKQQANSVLLWQAILFAKYSGCTWFDIGGLNEATQKGIADFKRGLNAAPYGLIGEWRWFLLTSP